MSYNIHFLKYTYMSYNIYIFKYICRIIYIFAIFNLVLDLI